MTTAYTSLLGLALPVTGELSGTWGDVVNNSITSLLDSAIAGTTNVSTDGDVTLTTTTGAANTAREAILLFSGSRTALRTVTAPAQSKIYTVINATTGGYAVKLVGSGPTTGVTIANGSSTTVAWNGSDFVEVSSPSSIILPNGTANGVLYLNGSKVVTSGSTLTYDGTRLTAIVESASEVDIARFQASNSGDFQFLDISADAVSNFVAFDVSGSTGGDYIFRRGGTEQMRLTGTGLGIGTSSPATKLQVAGEIRSSADISNSSDAVVYSYSGGSAGSVRSGLQMIGSTQEFRIYTAGSTRATLDSSGNLGLGVTPSAWGSSFKAYQVGNQSLWSAAAGNGYLSNNAFFNTSNSYIYRNNGFATEYIQSTVNGSHSWHVAPSGTAGNSISFTQAMTLDASGNLGLGTTSPASYGKFAVVGNIWYSGDLQCTTGGETARFGYEAYLGTGGFNLFTQGAKPLVFGTNSSERARIASSGSFLVGTSTDYAKFSVLGAQNSYIAYFSNTNNTAGDQVLRTVLGANANNTNSYHLVGTAGGADKVYIYGNGNIVNSNNSYGALSDAKLKENIVDTTPKLADLMQVKVRNYNLIGESTKQLGVVAQELETVFPSMIDETADRDAEGNDLGTTTKSVKYSVFVPMLIKAMQEQQAIIESLKARLDAANL